MKFGLTSEQYKFLLEKLAPLRGENVNIWCFGSRARGDHQHFSDLDIMVESEEDLSPLIGKINEELVESSFPYKVDIVQGRDFANSYRNGFEKDKVKF